MQFIGGPTLEDLFNSYEMNAPFVDVPADSQKASLHAFRKHRQVTLRFSSRKIDILHYEGEAPQLRLAERCRSLQW